ncbi:uncharacterized protein LOC118231765 isoform X2 [Anguilla anguilla]|uniref:uncharacterized protein LOC118231765 isoform X2 n=1 Tax=Anguilla anguilla TaxID=7936 RepID=UPI0015A8E308|nr:uncharacterized protein LOC118231765 isoform X2 [Anguilla anguilla]
MPVHRLTGLPPWLHFNIILLFTGVSGLEPTVYSSVGELVSLPCNLHGSFNCSSITWNWNSVGSPGTTELVAHGVVTANDQQIARKLRVGSNCSLHINNLTTADAGGYTCRQYHNTNNFTDDSVIKLSILNIFASSPVTELKIGSTVTLVCELHSPGSRGKSVRVSWVNETGDPLQGNRYKLSESECSSSLTVTLERSDRNMTWRCQLTVKGEVKASHSYTTIFPDEIKSNVWIGFGVAICAAVVLIVILIMICKRRTVQRKTAHNHVSQSHTVTDQNKGESEDTVTYAVVNPSAGGKRKQDQESAVLETEYAIIKTLQNSNKP